MQHKTIKDTSILVLDVWVRLDGDGRVLKPSPLPDRLAKVMEAHRDWMPAAKRKREEADAADEAADEVEAAAVPLPSEVGALNVDQLRTLAKRVGVQLGSAKLRDEILAKIAVSKAEPQVLVALATAIKEA